MPAEDRQLKNRKRLCGSGLSLLKTRRKSGIKTEILIPALMFLVLILFLEECYQMASNVIRMVLELVDLCI